MEETFAMLEKQIADNPILLYMKGSPEMPQCGFSAQVVRILAEYGHSYASVDVLSHPDIRKALPQYAQWPTFPQLYIKGELVGGCDIVTDLHLSGALKEQLDTVA